MEADYPPILEKVGTIHPINSIKVRLLEILSKHGFEPAEGPEIESEKYNFDMLNIKKITSRKTNARYFLCK